MGNLDIKGFNPESENSPLEVAKRRFGVDLNDDRATMGKIVELQGKMPEVADLGNLWRDYQGQKDQGEMEKAA